jgi:hypothetical protein
VYGTAPFNGAADRISARIPCTKRARLNEVAVPMRIAMLGMVDGNGHPYSWSAIINGYDPDEMAKCPYPTIPDYLGKEPPESFGIDGAKVTHVWTDDPSDAPKVAKASRIEHVVEKPEDVIGHVDAAIIATDRGEEHVDRCRAFVEAGVPVFVDKPMVDNVADLAVFRQWNAEGKPVLSSSCMAYAKEFLAYRPSSRELGGIRYATITTPKSWERYAIHALSAIYPILGPGFLTARNTGTTERNIVHYKHASGADVVVVAIDDMYGGFGCLQLCGTVGSAQVQFRDTFYAFKAQLTEFIRYVRTGVRPFPFSETEELMRMLIGGIQSRAHNGLEIAMGDI